MEVRNGSWGPAETEDPAEAVAAALLHTGPCRWLARSRSDNQPSLDWATFWVRSPGDPVQSLGEMVVLTAATVQRVEPGRSLDLLDLLDRLAGTGRDETQLCRAYLKRHRELRGRRGFNGWHALRHHGSRGHCPLCGRDIYPATKPCRSCADYPGGPDRMSAALDRLEFELGAGERFF